MRWSTSCFPLCSGGKLYHVDAMLAAAFPGTPVHARDLTSGTSSSERTWFSIELLQFLLYLRKNNPRFTVESTAKTIFEMHRRNDGEELLQEDTLRKLLAKTLDEYENAVIQQRIAVLAVSEEPQGPGGCVRACPACASLTGKQFHLSSCQPLISRGSFVEAVLLVLIASLQGKRSTQGPSHQVKSMRGPLLTAERDATTDEDVFFLHSVYADGNFRLRHETGRGRATKHDAPIQNFFVSKVDRHATSTCTKKLSTCWVFLQLGGCVWMPLTQPV
jgi:hypothetical protein